MLSVDVYAFSLLLLLLIPFFFWKENSFFRSMYIINQVEHNKHIGFSENEELIRYSIIAFIFEG